MKAFYAFLKIVVKLTLRLYFHRIKIEGVDNIPRNAPLIVSPNHQNAFLDALLVGAFMPISLFYLTRQDVFTRWSRPLLRMMHMIPIYRIRDGYSKLSLNDAIFESCRELFKNGDSVLIFAEGNHGRNHYLRPLTKGAARLALQAQDTMNENLMVLPVGINYFEHQAANSTVLIKFGCPISVSKYLNGYQESKAKGLINLRDAISVGMKETLVIPEETADYKELSDYIFQPAHEDFSFNELKAVHKSETPPIKRKKKHLLAWILNPFPMLIIKLIIRRVDDVVFHSSLKFGVGLVVFPIWWLLVFFIMMGVSGINIALLAVTVMAFGLYYSYLR